MDPNNPNSGSVKVISAEEAARLSFISVDDLEPRPPPRISKFPAPFNFPEKPKALVPDVSLIMDSDFSLNSSPGNLLNNTPKAYLDSLNASSRSVVSGRNLSHNSQLVMRRSPTSALASPTNPTSVKKPDSSVSPSHSKTEQDGFSIAVRDEILRLSQQITDQGKTMSKIEEKLNKIMEFQENFLSQLFRKGSAVSKQVQTDENECQISRAKSTKSCSSTSSESTTKRNRSPNILSGNGTTKNPFNIRGRNSPQTSSPRMDAQSNNPYAVVPAPANKIKNVDKGPLARLRNEAANQNNESLSSILKDMQMPSLHEPSAVYSEASGIRSLELQEFHDDSFRSGSGIDSPILGASASAYSSNSTSEESFDDENFSSSPAIKGGRMRACMPVRLASPTEQQCKADSNGDEVVLNTKKYLEKLGVQFGSPTNSTKNHARNGNYMIQQNVYNSIYIPTVNCAPVVPEALEYNGNGASSNFHSLAQKYVSPEELKEFDELKGVNANAATETTLYGMTPNNLSFATKDYLQRYGLVNEEQQQMRNELPPSPKNYRNGQNHYPNRIRNYEPQNQAQQYPRNDRILNITAIKNQPKLL